MKAIICTKPSLIENITLPYPEKKEGFAILKVKRIGICGTDLHAYKGTQPFFNYPRILGHELALEVVTSSRFEQGKLVTLIPYFNCGECIACQMQKPNCCQSIQVFGVHIDGGMKEFIEVPETAIVDGQDLPLDALALVEPLAIGLHGVNRAQVQPGENVLVVGAGPIGLGIMEMARIAGANVIALDVNQKRLDFCTNKLEVPYVINGLKEDALETLMAITKNNMPTVVIDATGNLEAMNEAFTYMSHGARYVLVGLQREKLSVNHPEFHKREATLMSSRNATISEFETVIGYIKNKQINYQNFITHRCHFDQVTTQFETWYNPELGIIKLLIDVDNA